MALNVAKGNMYNWGNVVTWNPLSGACPHECLYCYTTKGRLATMTKYKGEIALVEKQLKTDLYKCKGLKPPFTVFISSCNDLFTKQVPSEIIMKIMNKTWEYTSNTYLFQSKNPMRFVDFYLNFPPNTILGTTIESNRDYNNTKAPSIKERADAMCLFSEFKRMISIEPVMDFDLDEFVDIIKQISPDFVSIGADSKNSALIEPDEKKLKIFITEINKITNVKIKDNLQRLIHIK